MSIFFGSAKGTNYGVVEENLYNHKLGWYILRAKDDELALKLAKNMRTACTNKKLIYNQARRLEVINRGINTIIKTGCDCSSLVRACIKAAGYSVPNFTTATEVDTLLGTGLFDKLAYTKQNLHNGDILVTKTKGHTGIITAGAEITPKVSKAAKPIIRRGSQGDEVTILQTNFNIIGITDNRGKSLVIDGDAGQRTDEAIRNFQRKYQLKIDGIYGAKSYNKMRELV